MKFRKKESNERFSMPNQQERFANHKKSNNPRALTIDEVYSGKELKGKTCLVTGGNRGLGLAIANELLRNGANVIVTSRKQCDIENIRVINGIDVCDNDCGKKLVTALNGQTIDILINNAGYFYGPAEKIDSLNFDEEIKMIDICAVGPLRITSAVFNAGLLPSHSKVVMISSQGGSISWRLVQNPSGGDYGHHMSKAAENMMSVLLSQELKASNIPVGILHPGFNRTDMTAKYEHIWDIEGAVDSSIGAKRVCHEICLLNMQTTGKLINCEDGLEIPF